MYWYYDTTGKIIGHSDHPVVAWQESYKVVALSDTDSAPLVANPHGYTLPKGVITPMAQWHCTATTTSGTTTVTATLSNPPATLPSSVTWTLQSSTITGTVSSGGTATLDLTWHPSVATSQTTLSISASGTVGGGLALQSGSPASLQLVAPSTSGDPYLVAPTTYTQLRAYYLGLSPETQIQLLTQTLQNLYLVTALMGRTISEKILPALTSGTYTPITLSSAEQAALTNWQKNLQSSLLGWDSLLDGEGNPVAPYAEAMADAPRYLQSLHAYTHDCQTIPNLS
jgi:hypothetical protein